MKLNLERLFSSIVLLIGFAYLSYAKQDDCPRVQTFFDFQDLTDPEGHKDVTAITHIYGSTLVAIGTRVGAIEIWDYDSREIITKFFEDKWPIVKIDHIGHTNHIVVTYEKSNGNQVSIWDLVTQERTQWIIDENDSQTDYSQVLRYKVVDTYVSMNGNYFLQMSYKHVVACDIHNINNNSTQPICEVISIGKTIQDEIPQYIFSFDSQFENVFYILTKVSMYKIDRIGLSLSDKIYRVEDEKNIKIVDMIRTQIDGIIMIALSTNELITINLQTQNGSEKIYKLRDYLQYITLDQINILKSVRSFFSENQALMLFKVQDPNSSPNDKMERQVILTYNIIEDKVLQFETIYNVKYIAPINQSRSFIVVYNDDTVGWYAYPVIYKSLPVLTNSTPSIPTNTLDLLSNYGKQVIGNKGKYLLQDDLSGKIVVFDLLEGNIKKRIDLSVATQNSDKNQGVISMLPLDHISQFLVITTNFYIISYSYNQLDSEPIFVRNLSSLVNPSAKKQNQVSNTYMVKLQHLEYSVAIITEKSIFIFDYVKSKITHSINSQLNQSDIFLDCSLIYDLKTSTLGRYSYFMIANGQNAFKMYRLTVGDEESENEISSNITEELIKQIPNSNIVGWVYMKTLDILITQDSRNEFCRYTLSTQLEQGCFKVWYDESGFQLNVLRKRGLLEIGVTTIVAQLNDQRVVFIDMKSGLPTFSTCKFDVFFYQISQSSLDFIILIPPAVAKKKVAFLDFYFERPVNTLRNMNGVIQDSTFYFNKIVLNMKDGSFKILNVEEYKLYDLINADPSYQDSRKFMIDRNALIYTDSSNYIYTYTFDNQFNFVSFKNKFKIGGNAVTNTTSIQMTGIDNVIALVGLKEILFFNYQTQEVFPIYHSFSQNIVATDFNNTLSLIVVGLNNDKVQIINVEDISKPYVTHVIQAESKLKTVHHSIMFRDRVYFTYSTSIIRWDVLTDKLTTIQTFDNKIKEINFVNQLQAIVVFLNNGVVQIINDDKNVFYFINVYALTQSYANVDKLIYMNGLNSLAFVSDHRIWALTLHNFVEGQVEDSLKQINIQCEKGFYIESMQGQDYFNVLGQGTLNEPYRSVSAIRKETIKIGKSHKIFLYNMIKLNFFLQEGKTYSLEEPFQYATQKINSIVTFQTYQASSTAPKDVNNRKKPLFYDYKESLPSTTLIIKNSYRFENIQKLYFYNINMQMGSSFASTEEVRYSVFSNIDSISFYGCNFIPSNNKNFDVYIFEEVQLLKFVDVKIKMSQFLSSKVKAIYLEQVESSELPAIDSTQDKKKCLAYSQVIDHQQESKYQCKYFFLYPTSSEYYLFIETVSSVNYTHSNHLIDSSSSIKKQGKSKLSTTQKTALLQSPIVNNEIEQELEIISLKQQDRTTQQLSSTNNKKKYNNNFNFEDEDKIEADISNNIAQHNDPDSVFNEYLRKWTTKNSTDINDEDSYLKLNKTQYTLNNCTFLYVRIFTFLTSKDSKDDQTKIENTNYTSTNSPKANNKNGLSNTIHLLSPQLNITNCTIGSSTVFSGKEVDLEEAIADYYSEGYNIQPLLTSSIKYSIKNHVITQSTLKKVTLYDSTTFRIREVEQLRFINNTFEKLTMQLGRNKESQLKQILIQNNTFESNNNIPLFELGENFQLSSIYLINNTFTQQVLFQYKSDFNSVVFTPDDDNEDYFKQDNPDSAKTPNIQTGEEHINNSTVANIILSDCSLRKSTVFQFNEVLYKSVFHIENITLQKISMVETLVVDVSNIHRFSQVHIKSFMITKNSALRTCVVRKQTDQILFISDVHMHKNTMRYSNFLQTKRPQNFQNKDNFLTSAFQNMTIHGNQWFNSKLAELTANSLLLFTNSYISNNTLISDVSSSSRLSKYFLELDHIILENVELYSNQFMYQLFCGPPMINNQYIDYNFNKLNITNNTFTGQSNALLIESTFSILSQGSSVRLTHITMKENIRKDSSITRGTFLVEGYRFFFFHFDKVQNTQVIYADMYYNTDIGFGIFKSSIGYNSIEKLVVINNPVDTYDLVINIPQALNQPILIIRNCANFTVKNSLISKLRIYNSPIFEVESNKNFYIKTANSSSENSNQELTPIMQISNVTFQNNVIQIDPYLCLGSMIDYISNLKTKVGFHKMRFDSNVIKGLNQNSLIQAQINVIASQSDIKIDSSQFVSNIDYRFVKNIADAVYLQIEAKSIGIYNSYFSSLPNNQKDEETRPAIRFSLQVVGLMKYQQFKFYQNTIKQMRSSNFGILDLSTISDTSTTDIAHSQFEDLIPKNFVFDIKGNLFSSKTNIKNCTFSYVFNQIVGMERVSYVMLEMFSNTFYQVFAQQNTLLNIINTQRNHSIIYFQNNTVNFNSYQIKEKFDYYSQSESIFEFVKAQTKGATSLLNITEVKLLSFLNNTFSGHYTDRLVMIEMSMIHISNVKLVVFQNNKIDNIKSSYLSVLSFSNSETISIQNLTITNCSLLDQYILQIKYVDDVEIKNLDFSGNSLTGFSRQPCIVIKNSCFKASNLKIRENSCLSDGVFQILYNKKLVDEAKCLTSEEQSSSQPKSKYISSVQNSLFERNKGTYYGAIQIYNTFDVMVLLKENQIQSNRCENGSGGGIFIHTIGSNNFQIEKTTISNNYALARGGGVYIDEDIPQSLVQLNPEYIFNNISPSSLQICSNGRVANFILNRDDEIVQFAYTSLSQSNILQIKDQQSGGDLPSILVEILDVEGSRVQPYMVATKNLAVLSLSESTQSQGYYLKGDLEAEYNLSKGGFLFQNISIYGKPDSTINMTFTTSMIEYEGLNSTQKLRAQYVIQMQIQIRKCIIGEIYFNNNLIESCQPCPEKEYSLEDPNSIHAVSCLECPKNANCPGRNLLSIHSGYWRKDSNSLEIIECGTEPRNCLGGISQGDSSCAENMKGPLCEQCDIERGYTNISSSKCLACSEIGLTLTIILSVLLFFLIYVLISIDSTVRRIKHSRSISSKSGANTVFVASMVVKLFISYLQVISIIGTFQLNINPFATQGALSLGNPILSFSNAMDCYLHKIGQSIGVNHIYLNFFSSLLIPLTFMILISLVDYFNNKKNYYYRSYFCKTMFLVILLFFAPLAFQNGLKLITCRKVGNSGSFISYNLLYECFTSEYYTYSIMVVGPLIFIICVVIPFILAILIKKRKQKKVSIKTYQYLLGDYKDTTYFWEFIKYTQKLTIMMISVYFSQDIKTKALFINLILIIYGTVVFFVKPFRTEILNRLDIFTTLIIFLSINFGLMAYEKSETNQVQWYFCIAILSIMNIPLFSWYIYTIFKCYAPWFSMKKRNMKICLMRFRIFRSNYNPKERAQFNWKNLYKKYIEAMKAQKFGGRQVTLANTNDNTDFDHIPFLKNKKNISFQSEATDINYTSAAQAREEEITTYSEAISDFDEESPDKALKLKFKGSSRKSYESPKASSFNSDSQRKRYQSSGHSSGNLIKKRLSIDLLNDSQNVHSRFSQLVQALKENQEDVQVSEFNKDTQEEKIEPEEDNIKIKRNKSHDSGEGE